MMRFGRRRHEEDEYPSGMHTDRREGFNRFVFFALLAVSITGGYALSQFRGLGEPVAMETAQVARHLAEGRGLVTHCIRPFDLWYLQSRGGRAGAPDRALPVLWTPPGLPALQAVFLRLVRPRYQPRGPGGYIVDAESGVIVPVGIVLTLLTTLVLWGLGGILFGNRTALLAAGAFTVADLTLSAAISGLPVAAAALPATLAVLLAVLAVRRSAVALGGVGVAVLTVASALCAAAAVLTDYSALAAAAAAALLLGAELQRRRWLMLPLYLLVLVLALLPWGLHHQMAGRGVAGAAPYAALRETPLFPADSLERSVAPVFNAYRVAAAVRLGVASRLETLAGGGVFRHGGVMICFFILAVFYRYESPVCRTLKWATVMAVVAAVLLPGGPGTPGGGGWVVLYPLVVLFGTSAFTGVLDREEYFDPGLKPLLTALLLLLCLLPAGLRVLRGPAGVYPPYYAPAQRFAAEAVEPGRVLLTDIPWATAWYGGVASVRLPLHPDDVGLLPGGWAAVGGVYLTVSADRADSIWALMQIGRQVPESVPFTHGIGLPAGGQDQLLLLKPAPGGDPDDAVPAD